jgi:hypothetical protein
MANGSSRDRASPSTGIGLVRFKLNPRQILLSGRYSYYIVGPAEVDRARALPGLPLVYKSAMDVDSECTHTDYCPTGVTYREAARNAWVLTSPSGDELANGRNRLADVGDEAFQKRWLTNVMRFLRAHKAKGVFIDGAAANVDLYSGGVFPSKYPTNQAWKRAMTRFIAYVGPSLKNNGIYVVINTANFVAGHPGTNNGTVDARWWKKIGKYVSGLSREHWQQNPKPPRQVYTQNPSHWMGHWTGWLSLVTTAQAMDRDFFGIQWGLSSNVQLLRYGRASFLLAWNGRRGAYVFAATDGMDPPSRDWAVDVGRPIGRRQRAGVGWKRRFTQGIVILNPSETTTQRFSLGRRYQVLNQPAVSSVTLKPTSALILRRPPA